MNIKKVVYQFKITLKEIEPVIWRRIVVPATYGFWDLHVAMQDSMGLCASTTQRSDGELRSRMKKNSAG